MKKIINSMIYGDTKTKLLLWCGTALMIVSILLIVISALKGAPILFIVGLVLGFAVLIGSQYIKLDDTQLNINKKDQKSGKLINGQGEKNSLGKKINNDILDNREEKNKLTELGSEKKLNNRNENGDNEKIKEQGENKKEEKQKEGENKKEKKQKESKNKIEEKQKESENISTKKSEDKEKNIKDKKNKEDGELAEAIPKLEDIEVFAEDQYKKLMYTYKVKKDHKIVLIEESKRYKIKECPAFMWTQKNEIFFLLLEKEPRKFSIPHSSVSCIRYIPNVTSNPSDEYLYLEKTSLTQAVFSPLKPDYRTTNLKGRIVTLKNLYSIDPDFKFTNNSVKNLMELLDVEFKVDDKVSRSNDVNEYFKQAHYLGILLRDSVMEISVYTEKIKNLLQNMSDDKMPYEEFENTIGKLVTYHLITEDFAEYYIQYRIKKNKDKK